MSGLPSLYCVSAAGVAAGALLGGVGAVDLSGPCWCWWCRVCVALGVDEVGEPAHLALDGLDRVAAQLAEVAVVAAGGVALAVEALLEPRTTALEDAQPDVGAGAREEREPHVEALVLPRVGPVVGDLLGEHLAPGRRDLVGDPLTQRDGGGVGHLGDHPVAKHPLERGVERAVGEQAGPPEQQVEPLAQLVAVQRRLVEQAENGHLQRCALACHAACPLSLRSIDPTYRVNVSKRYIGHKPDPGSTAMAGRPGYCASHARRLGGAGTAHVLSWGCPSPIPGARSRSRTTESMS